MFFRSIVWFLSTMARRYTINTNNTTNNKVNGSMTQHAAYEPTTVFEFFSPDFWLMFSDFFF